MKALEGNDLELEIGSGTVRDVFFFIGQIVQGVPHGHFSPRALIFSERFELFGQCCRALYWQHWDELLGRSKNRPARPSIFVVAKSRGRTVGAMLLDASEASCGSAVVGIADVVVDPAWRRRGIGSRLVQGAIDQAPLTSFVICACTPNSLAMMKLLNKLRFKLVAQAATVNGIRTPNIFEYRKVR